MAHSSSSNGALLHQSLILHGTASAQSCCSRRGLGVLDFTSGITTSTGMRTASPPAAPVQLWTVALKTVEANRHNRPNSSEKTTCSGEPTVRPAVLHSGACQLVTRDPTGTTPAGPGSWVLGSCDFHMSFTRRQQTNSTTRRTFCSNVSFLFLSLASQCLVPLHREATNVKINDSVGIPVLEYEQHTMLTPAELVT